MWNQSAKQTAGSIQSVQSCIVDCRDSIVSYPVYSVATPQTVCVTTFHVVGYCGVGSEGVTICLDPLGHFPTFLTGVQPLPSLFSLSLMAVEEETPVPYTPEQRAWLLKAFGPSTSRGTTDSPGDGTVDTATDLPSQDPPPPGTASSGKRIHILYGLCHRCGGSYLRSPGAER